MNSSILKKDHLEMHVIYGKKHEISMIGKCIVISAFSTGNIRVYYGILWFEIIIIKPQNNAEIYVQVLSTAFLQ